MTLMQKKIWGDWMSEVVYDVLLWEFLAEQYSLFGRLVEFLMK